MGTVETPSRVPSVILAFRAENVRSFREPLELSLVATGISDADVVRDVVWRDEGRTVGVLPAAAIYGANAAGKSNLLRAMDDMRSCVLHSFRSGDPNGGTIRHPFALDPTAKAAPSTFEVDLVLDGVRHAYGFTMDDERFTEEFAYHYPRGRAVRLFHREGDRIHFGTANRAKSRAAEGLLRPNALFLSTAAAAGHPTLTRLYEWFARNLLLAEANSRPFRQALTADLLKTQSGGEKVRALLRVADLGIIDVERPPIDPVIAERVRRAVRILHGKEGDSDGTDDGFEFPELGITLLHQGTDGPVAVNAYDESLGTLVWFGLVGPIVQALETGAVLLADELDASLHPHLVDRLVQLFQNPGTNPHRSQLIFNTHDSTLLGDTVGRRLLGRDQVWFTEKLTDGNTRIYPLSSLDPRKDEAVGRRYLAGRYGGVPIVAAAEFEAAAELITSGEP